MTVTSKLPDWCLQSIEESNKPMSLDEIRGKFVEKFPFKAKRVAGECSGSVFTLLRKSHGGELLTLCLSCQESPGKATDGDYLSKECTRCHAGHKSPATFCPDKKAWLYQG